VRSFGLSIDLGRADALPNLTGYVSGLVFIVAGGLVAAVARPTGFALGSWLAAYLVLVLGAAGCIIAAAPTVLGATERSATLGWVQWTLWLIGNALVVIGPLVTSPMLTDIGAVPLVVALVVALASSRRPCRLRWLAWVYRIVLAVLIVSVPVGLVLAAIDAG
jgi:hypothetical protein